MDIFNKKIVLTGAASGIGKALLNCLSSKQVKIVAADINGSELSATINNAPGKSAQIYNFIGDLSQPDEIDSLFATAVEQIGGIDIFIANAGFPYYEMIDRPDWEHISSIYQLNVFSPIYSLEKMFEINRGKDFRMVITSSAMAHIAIPGYALYSSTKASLDRFAEGFRFELLSPHQLMLVYPIATRTAFFQSPNGLSPAPLPFPSQHADTVANAIMKGLKHDRLSVYPSMTFSLFYSISIVIPFLRKLYQAFEFHRFSKWLRSNKE